MICKSKSALSVVIALAVVGAASAALAGTDRDDTDRGGYVIPGSTVGVNPVHHPYYFGSPPNYECFERFRTYDVVSETYLGPDGRRHPCRRR
jgi:hypothetical protein